MFTQIPSWNPCPCQCDPNTTEKCKATKCRITNRIGRSAEALLQRLTTKELFELGGSTLEAAEIVSAFIRDQPDTIAEGTVLTTDSLTY